MSVDIVHVPIYRDFINAWCKENSWASIKDNYIETHQKLLAVFYRGFVSRALSDTQDETRVLGYTEEQFAWCREHEDVLWREVVPKLERPLTMDGYARYFSFGADDIPPRSAYYLGLKLVERYVTRTAADLADIVRLPVEVFASHV